LTLKIKDMSKLSVSIPENLLGTINQRIESGDYSSISDYIRDLIRRDMQEPHRAGQGDDQPDQHKSILEDQVSLPLP
jgi:Arc/MetJ-type ribon-helix-helix transcriptional regulator